MSKPPRKGGAPLSRLDLDGFEALADAYDDATLVTPDVDAACTSAAWVVSAHRAFHPEQEPFLFQLEGDGFLALARDDTPVLGRYLAPLEAMWGLASPIVSHDPMTAARGAAAILRALDSEWDALWLCGLAPRSAAFNTLAMLLGAHYRLFLGPTTRRHVATLEGGLDGFLARRSSRLRRNLRRALRCADELGVTWHWHDDVSDPAERDALYRRVLAIDDASWKGQSAQGLNASQMGHFYDLMTARLASRDRLRLVVARLDGEDVAFGFGSVFGDTFRGLQMSFDDRFRHLSLGNLVQLKLLEHLCEDPTVTQYDLGSDIEYKRRWAEPGLETVALVVRK